MTCFSNSQTCVKSTGPVALPRSRASVRLADGRYLAAVRYPTVSAPSSAWPVRVVLAIYSVCFLVGTYTHAAGLIQRGFLSFPVPVAVGVFWDSLTLLDPLAAGLVWLRPRLGVPLAVAIMVVDISVNTHVYLAGYFKPPVAGLVPLSLLEQALFGLFVFVTALGVYRQLARPRVLPSDE